MRKKRTDSSPSEPIKQTSLEGEHMDVYVCPFCCATLRYIDDARARYPKECPACGQKIKWIK